MLTIYGFLWCDLKPNHLKTIFLRLLHRHWRNRMLVLVPMKQPGRLRVNVSHESTCCNIYAITTTKQRTMTYVCNSPKKYAQGSPQRPLARYVKLHVAHAPGMFGTFSPPPLVRDPDMHRGTSVKHVPWCMLGSLTSGFLWSQLRRKRSQHSHRMHNLQFYVSDKRPMMWLDIIQIFLIL